ncbi:DUF4259 domain-containing protein, partial [Acrocarpospora sp. B8E8]|uniref:DUF4259 domain-containing protein n=1 Tax=Acrocarpospora sp. B8E8 TaxID=3153572 RepID=UPI00325F4DBE
MGTWDVGPFDNDHAADWCGHLNDAPAEKRPQLIRRAFTQVMVEDGYLECVPRADAPFVDGIGIGRLVGGSPFGLWARLGEQSRLGLDED